MILMILNPDNLWFWGRIYGSDDLRFWWFMIPMIWDPDDDLGNCDNIDKNKDDRDNGLVRVPYQAGSWKQGCHNTIVPNSLFLSLLKVLDLSAGVEMLVGPGDRVEKGQVSAASKVLSWDV